MKAMCPFCGGTGAHSASDSGDRCFKCRGHGQIDVTLAEGELYTLKCKVCGYENGGRIVNAEIPLPKNGPDIGCVACGVAKDQVHYVKVGKED